MAEVRVRTAAGRPVSPGRIGVIDLGTNSVRLVVFDGASRVPLPVFNEKAVCAIGRGTPSTGRLDPEGSALAMESLARFVALARSMGVERPHILATAAVREAADGAAFARAAEDRLGLPVEILAGVAESRLAALGILCGLPDADGLMGDLGGGSLDLVTLDRGKFGAGASLPLGLLWLADVAKGDLRHARRVVDDALAELAWIGAIRGRTLFAVGGAWRALASISINQARYPLHILDNYTLPAAEAIGVARVIAGLGRKTLEKMPGVSARRLESLPLSALLLERLLIACGARTVVFSGHGMREGQFFKLLPSERRAEDPVIGACAEMGWRIRRFDLDGEQIAAWIAPAFKGDPADLARLRRAACHLSDLAWADHPSYRGFLAFHRVLRLPFAGLTHRDRVLLAFAVGYRYGRDPDPEAPVRGLISAEDEGWARRLGYTLRLAYAFCGGVAEVLARGRLKLSKTHLSLALPEEGALFASDSLGRRLQSAARAFGLKSAMTSRD